MGLLTYHTPNPSIAAFEIPLFLHELAGSSQMSSISCDMEVPVSLQVDTGLEGLLGSKVLFFFVSKVESSARARVFH